MRWTAIIPINHGRPRKTRLADVLSQDDRERLVAAMAERVIAALEPVTDVWVLAPEEPPYAAGRWLADGGGGLNAELAAACMKLEYGPTLFIHGDLPLLSTVDVTVLLEAAEANDAAIAPDLTDSGTNALAIRAPKNFVPLFGDRSFVAHQAALPHAIAIRRQGLALDVDDYRSLASVRSYGFDPTVE